MLPPDRLQLALDIHARSYRLLKWVAEAIGKGFIAAARAHEYADVTDAAYDWIEEHYQNLPTNSRPERSQLLPFANFFATYVMSSFDVIEQPGLTLESPCGCYCRFCSYLVKAPHLKAKRILKRDKERALRLMADRVQQLALEADITVTPDLAERVATDEATRRSAAYSAYGHWLIKRLDGLSDGPSILALWREIAWNKSGSPFQRFELKHADFVTAEEALLRALQST
jgi:hypothetical protein